MTTSLRFSLVTVVVFSCSHAFHFSMPFQEPAMKILGCNVNH